MADIFAPPRFEDIMADEEMYFASQSARATDFNPGSVVRTILEIVAQIQERRDVAVWSSLNRAVDEAVFDAWGFTRREAQPASGQITLYPGVGVTTPFFVNQGALFRVPGSPTLIYQAVSYASNPDGTFGWKRIGDSGSPSTATQWYSNPDVSASTLNIRAIQPGKAGNVAARLITEAMSSIPGVAQIKNVQALTNGSDASTEADRRAAFTAYIQSLPRGTIEALKYGAKTASLTDSFGLVTEQVRKVGVIEGTVSGVVTPLTSGSVTLGSGHVGLFVNNGVGAMSTDLLTLTQKVIDGYTDSNGVLHPGWRAAGIPVTVYEALRVPQDVVVHITAATGFQTDQIAELVKIAIQNAFTVLDVGDTLLYTDLLMFIKLVPGVLDVSLLTVGGGSINVTPSTPIYNSLITLHTITGTVSMDGTSISFSYGI